MTPAAIFLLIASGLAVLTYWVLPRGVALSGVAALTLVTLLALSPASALWLTTSSLLTVLVVRHCPFEAHRGWVLACCAVALVSFLLASRELELIFWVGGAYFTLRHLHVLLEWWMGRLQIPTVRQYLEYSFFLPVIMSGPIHRVERFQREARRMVRTPNNLFAGAERTLVGLAQVTVLSSWLLRRLRESTEPLVQPWPSFFQQWLAGALDWLQLYFSFAGYTSVALGLALMMGFRLEGNFNRPWAANNLIDFWGRWHMTLSGWCRDYVFRPITAQTRMPVVGLIAAMLAMGLWHDSSSYYVLWAIWQSMGIMITHTIVRLGREYNFSSLIGSGLGPLSVYVWLSLTRPVVMQLQQQLDL